MFGRCVVAALELTKVTFEDPAPHAYAAPGNTSPRMQTTVRNEAGMRRFPWLKDSSNPYDLRLPNESRVSAGRTTLRADAAGVTGQAVAAGEALIVLPPAALAEDDE